MQPWYRFRPGHLLLLAGGLASAAALAAPTDIQVPRYDHILVIIGENESYGPMTSGESTPNLKRLAAAYGVASNFFAEVHPSEGNYVAMLGGSTFGIHDDDAFYCKPGMVDRYCSKSDGADYADHTVRARSLVDQLEEHHLSWKGYFQDIPEPGSPAVRFPEAPTAGTGSLPGLYAVKHNGFMNFARLQEDPARARKIVGFDQLTRDLASGQVPAYAQIVPNQCDDMHGIEAPGVPADCEKANEDGRRARGDAAIAGLVDQIQRSPIWARPGNAAIVITFDEDGKPRDPAAPQGCCGVQSGSPAEFGGGHIVTIVITNHGPRGVTDPTPYNHYSLLRTTEDAFGIDEHLAHAGDTAAGVAPMTALFAVAP
jgi:phosphatidylinositol-3-phosphatase